MITKKINHSIHRLHVMSIISVLIDEMIKELKRGGEIKIPNFGTLKINDLKPKKIRSISTNKIKFAKRTKSLRFRLSKKISKYLSDRSLEEMRNAVKTCEEKQEQ
jgi:nucleoid DNA-binding protein